MITVTLCCAIGPCEVYEEVLQLPEGSSMRDAVMTSGLLQRHATLDWGALTPGIWGRVRPWTQPLAAGDRVELCRPLLVDPKVARRERFQQKGRRSTGLFARSRPGGKAGY